MFGYKNFFTIYDKLNGKNKNIYITEDEMTDKNFIIIKKYKAMIDPIKNEFLKVQKQIPQDKMEDYKTYFMNVYTSLNDFYNYISKPIFNVDEQYLDDLYYSICTSFIVFKNIVFSKFRESDYDYFNDVKDKTFDNKISIQDKIFSGNQNILDKIKRSSNELNTKNIQQNKDEWKNIKIIDDFIYSPPEKQIKFSYDKQKEETDDDEEIEKIKETKETCKNKMDIDDCIEEDIEEDIEEKDIEDIEDIEKEKEKEEIEKDKDEWYNISSFNYSVFKYVGKLDIKINEENTLYKFFFSFNYDNGFDKNIKKDYCIVNKFFEQHNLNQVWNTNELSFVQKIENEFNQFTEAFRYLQFMMKNEYDFIKFVDSRPSFIKEGKNEIQKFIDNMINSHSNIHNFNQIFKDIFKNYLNHEFVERNSLDYILIYTPLDNLKKTYNEPDIWKIENFKF